MRSNRLIAMMALAAAGSVAAQVSAGAASLMRAGAHLLPAPARPERTSTGLPGMGHGTKVRGNRAVRRASVKARNIKRHRAHCRGRA